MKDKNNLPNFSDEERAAMTAKATETREANKAWAKENLRDNYADFPVWLELSKKYDCRLPHWYTPASETKYVKRTLKKLNLTNEWWLNETGCSSYKDFIDINPDAPAYLMVGLILEAYDKEQYEYEKQQQP